MIEAGSAVGAARADALLSWYEANQRDLPWRGVGDPYRGLVSEVMLQQTQASRVIGHYEKFLARFPDVDSLARASLPEVLEAWSGLGYNSRAKRLLAAAQQIAADGWPTTVDGLLALPGVGPYTAAAIACFAFGVPVAAPDTNARRIISRWRGEALEGTALIDAAAVELREPAAAWNQAIMDLGATVCLPRAPRCGACPVSNWCAGPDAYRPPRPQGVFSGSTREARGAIIRSLLSGYGATSPAIAEEAGLEQTRVRDAVDGLVRDGIVTVTTEGKLALAEG